MLEVGGGRATACPECGTEVAPHFLVCPGCHRLVHAEDLKRLADSAVADERAGEPALALSAWRSALELLPPESRQHETIRARVEALGRLVDASPGGKPAAKEGAGLAGGIGIIGVALMILTKAKFLLFGVFKLKTFVSMFAMLGVYWAVFGWKWAAGILLSLYIHEMGHVAALLRYGVKADAPLFVPFGAMVRLRQPMTDPRQDAQVGLAGPLWGLGAALACWGAFLGTGGMIFAAIAKVGAAINLLNLIPVWQLDGARAFNALKRTHRWLATVALAAIWAATEQKLLILLMIGGAYRAGFERSPAESDAVSLAEYLGLAVVLALMIGIEVPIPGG